MILLGSIFYLLIHDKLTKFLAGNVLFIISRSFFGKIKHEVMSIGLSLGLSGSILLTYEFNQFGILKKSARGKRLGIKEIFFLIKQKETTGASIFACHGKKGKMTAQREGYSTAALL